VSKDKSSRRKSSVGRPFQRRGSAATNARSPRRELVVQVITQRRGVAKRAGCIQQRLRVSLSVCFFVSVFVRTITSDDQTWRLGTSYKNLARVRRSRSKVKGQGHQGQKKRNTAESSPLTMHSKACAVGGTQQAANRRYHCVAARGDRLRRWENQRMLSSCRL